MLAINIVTLFNLILLFCLLWFRKNNSLPNKLLALIIINPGLNFLGNINIITEGIFSFPHSIFLFQITCLYFAPLVYNYAEILMGRKIKWLTIPHMLTLATSLLGVYFWIDFLLLSPTIQEIYISGLLAEDYPMEINIINGLFILLQQAYFTITAIKVYRYKNQVKNYFSDLSATRFFYLKRFIQLIWALNIITIGLYLSLETMYVEYIWLPVVLNIIFGFIVYFSFNYNTIFTEEDFESFSHRNEIIKDETKDDIKEESNTELESLILSKVEECKELTRAGITISELGVFLDIPTHRISTILNKNLNKSFNDVINEARIRKSKQLIQNNIQNMSLEGIGLEVGFSNRASFYRWFKKIESCTPKEFEQKK